MVGFGIMAIVALSGAGCLAMRNAPSRRILGPGRLHPTRRRKRALDWRTHMGRVPMTPIVVLVAITFAVVHYFAIAGVCSHTRRPLAPRPGEGSTRFGTPVESKPRTRCWRFCTS
jgi:hypothetical protein